MMDHLVYIKSSQISKQNEQINKGYRKTNQEIWKKTC